MNTRGPSSPVRFDSIRRRLALAVALALALGAALPVLAAKSKGPVLIKLKPPSATLPVDGIKRFTASVKNTPDRAVTWTVDGVPGGNEVVGTVNERGVYRAPAWSGGGITVTVKAASVADPAATASARVKILPGGAPLVVDAVAPAAIESGPVSLTLTGAGFTPACRVALGKVELAASFVSATQLVATGVVPDELAPQAALVVVDPGPPRRASQPRTIAITVRPPPAIASVTPSAVHPGPVTLAISGSGFDAASRVLLGAQELATTLLSPTALEARGVVPESMVPGAPLVVVDAANPARRSAPYALTVSLPPLVLAAAEPARVYNGPVTFTITGSGFEADTVARLGELALATTVRSATELSASGEVPESMVPGAALVLVDGSTPDRRSAPLAIAIERVTPLALSSVEPAALYAGAVELTIRGSGFTPTTRVQLGGLALTTTFISDRLLFAAGIVPDAMAPGASLVLLDEGPPARRSDPLAVPVTPVEPLVVTAVSPDKIAPGKVTFTITGSGFDADTRAAIGTTPLTTKFLSATSLQATGTVPEGLAPGADLVLHDGGPPARDSAPYRIAIEALAPIQLSSVTPSTVATGSASFTLEGSGFTPASKATLGSLALTTTFVSPTRLTATGTIPTSMVPRASMTVVESTPTQRRSNAITVTIEYGVNTKVTIDPATASIPAASGMQFHATLQGDPEHPFDWAVNGIPGGNDALGKVNGDGWYTAPPMPPVPPVVTITATSSTTPPATGQSVVTITNPLPTIAGVFPDAVRPGAFTISVRGAGYMPTSRVLYDGVDIAATYVSPTRLEARGTASRETGRKAAIQVVNPDPGGSISPSATLAILSDPATTTYRVSAAEAGRFLEQAAFGPDAETLDRVRELGFAGWIDEQFALPESEYPEPLEKCLDVDVRLAFSRAMLQGEDQLRQRTIFALGQIVVISANKTGDPEQLLIWQRMLSQQAFGTYRELLEAVTLSPTMGRYLDLANSAKAAADGSSQPNENYPREVLQLFSIGLDQLNPDGTPVMGGDGKPVPTYTQDTILEMARAMTGWGWPVPEGETFRWPTRQNYQGPMVPYDPAHDTGSKVLLSGFTIPAGGSAVLDMEAALDNIASHPNVGPFIGTRLIRHMVKSNPSPAYVARVSQAFENDGKGVRGDLRAVLKAVLLDPEARSAELTPEIGKLREPILYLAGVLRALDGQVQPDRTLTLTETRDLGQRLLESPSVFNYFSPLHQVEEGLFGPEFQIYTPLTSVSRANLLYRYLNENYRKEVAIDLEPYRAVAGQPTQLVDLVDERFFQGRMSAGMRDSLLRSLNAHSTSTTRRAMTALYLALSSGEYLVQH